MAKKTKQAEIEDLKTQILELTKQVHDAQMRTATVSEEKAKLEEQVEYLKAKHELTYSDQVVLNMHANELRVAAEFYAKRAETCLRIAMKRGAKRAEHDLEYAIVRELIHTNNELDAVNLRRMSEQHPKADLARLIRVAAEFDGERPLKKEENPPSEWKAESGLHEVRVWWTGR